MVRGQALQGGGGQPKWLCPLCVSLQSESASLVQWCIPVIQLFERLRQEDHTFKASQPGQLSETLSRNKI